MNKGKYLLFLLENGIILDYGNKESERKRMNAYTDFATVYDLFMEEVPYDQWLSFLEEIWQADKWGHDANHRIFPVPGLCDYQYRRCGKTSGRRYISLFPGNVQDC